ncbi:hypothetical protein LWI29_038261 [Acer saccharum]|uniref:Malectin-like domain-containing protein n=1 Tax=Acer saccharum TaxID=4024 RepID=A0AA39RFE0_ACESA|nr:hypothetical protein LWI29_038261 [Acer saccharum]
MIPILGVGLRMLGPSSCCQPSLQFPKPPLRTLWSLKFLNHNPSFYGFPIVHGRMLVRLCFYSNSYNGLNATDAVFSVTACNRLNATNNKFFFLPGSLSLLRNFNTAQTTEALNYVYIVNGYLIAGDGDTLTIKFTPSTNSSNAYAFMNGVEVMFMPDIYKNDDGTLILVGQNYLIYIDNTTALENVYRINVGGNDISPFGDTRFVYLARLHFYEVQADITTINQRTFNILLDNETAEFRANVIRWAKHNGVPVYKDYAVIVPSEGPQQDLWLALHPDLSTQFEYDDAILNEVEIFKLSDTDCNLIGANPIPGPQHIVD